MLFWELWVSTITPRREFSPNIQASVHQIWKDVPHHPGLSCFLLWAFEQLVIHHLSFVL